MIFASTRMPVRLVLILLEGRHGIYLRFFGVRRNRIGVMVVAHERTPHLLCFIGSSSVVERVSQEIVDASKLGVVRELSNDSLVESDRRPQRDCLVGVWVFIASRTLLVERGQSIHRVGRRLRL